MPKFKEDSTDDRARRAVSQKGTCGTPGRVKEKNEMQRFRVGFGLIAAVALLWQGLTVPMPIAAQDATPAAGSRSWRQEDRRRRTRQPH